MHPVFYLVTSGKLPGKIRERFRLCLFIFSDDFILFCLFNQTFQDICSLNKEQSNTSKSHGVSELGLSLTQ